MKQQLLILSVFLMPFIGKAEDFNVQVGARPYFLISQRIEPWFVVMRKMTYTPLQIYCLPLWLRNVILRSNPTIQLTKRLLQLSADQATLHSANSNPCEARWMLLIHWL